METQEIVRAAGGARKVASELGLSFQAVYQWSKVPPLHVLKVAQLSGIPPHVIRPEIYPRP